MSYTTSLDFSEVTPFGNNEGKNSKVFIAHDEQLGSDFIMKVIAKKDIYKDYNCNDASNLFNESKILYCVKHPNIMEIQHASYDADNVCFVMPICKNGSINSLIEQRYLTSREIIKYSLEFLSGLHYIHTKKLIHFDIKPTNILIDNNGKAILTDFGLSKFVDAYGFAQPNKIYQTHKPPEGCDDYKFYTNLSDIYQAGVTIYRLCNGNVIYKKQYEGKTLGELEKNIKKGIFPDRKFYLPHISQQLRVIINKAMHINPDKRFQTVLDLMNKLSNIADNHILDWRYETLANIEKWSIINNNMTHLDQIVLEHVSDTEYRITGFKKRLKDGNITNHNTWKACLKSLNDAYKTVEALIEEY